MKTEQISESIFTHKAIGMTFSGFFGFTRKPDSRIFYGKTEQISESIFTYKAISMTFSLLLRFLQFFRVLLHFLKYLKIRENPDSRIFYGKTFLLMSYWTILTLYCLEAVTWGWPAKKALLKITQNLKKSISVRVSYLINLKATGVIV